MTVRNDVVVDFNPSPRIVTVEVPSTEYSMQDLVDTERNIEDSFRAMSEPKLLNASGKEDLGGGVVVGITVAHQDAQVAFQPRFTPAETGTITTDSGAPIGSQNPTVRLIDTSADFVTAGVARGSYYVNFTDGSVGDVVEVIGANELRVTVPVQGATNDFTSGDSYKVWNITQVFATGGNLTAVDSDGNALNAVLPTWGTQVVLTSASSATLQELNEIRFSVYQNKVWVDTTTSNTGTIYPSGTPLQPVNNFPDAVAIGDALGIVEIQVLGDATLDTGDDVSGFLLRGQDEELTLITINAGANVLESQFRDASITGTLDGDSALKDCVIIPPLSFIEGTIKKCLIEVGTITLAGSNDVTILDCWSGVAGLSTPIIDFNGSGRDLVMRNWSGGIQINNKNGADNVSIDLTSGQIILDSTVTAGTVRVAGVGQLTDNSSGTTVNSEGLMNNASIAAAVWNAVVASYAAVGSFGEYVGKKVLTVQKFIGLK